MQVPSTHRLPSPSAASHSVLSVHATTPVSLLLLVSSPPVLLVPSLVVGLTGPVLLSSPLELPVVGGVVWVGSTVAEPSLVLGLPVGSTQVPSTQFHSTPPGSIV